ncbi:MAG: hypothetical protein KDA65_16535 [Planctomycetaceae bacterium]|nr:hypothetical protein [Planctomycetaceae bacterium]
MVNLKLSNHEIVRQSFGRCCVQADFFDRFYEIFISHLPANVAAKFANTDMPLQKLALKNGISNLLSFAQGKTTGKMAIERLAESHDRNHINIEPEHYNLWINSLLETLREHDAQWENELEQHWVDTLRVGIDYMISRY